MIGTVFVYLFLPETKNIPIEKMVLVWKDHWFWSKFVADDHVHEEQDNVNEMENKRLDSTI